MRQCVVCKADYVPGSPCPRCGSDNGPWETWQKSRPVEQGGWWGLLAFLEPHSYAPLFVTLFSLVIGLVGAGIIWVDIRSDFRLLIILMTPSGCLLSILRVYEARLKIRELALLGRGLSPHVKASLSYLVALAFAWFCGYTLFTSDFAWALVQSVLLRNPLPAALGPLDRLTQVLLVTSFLAYPFITVCLTYSSTLLSAERYARELNRVLPNPLPNQLALLVKVVKSEAAAILGASVKDVTWGQFQRTQEGDVELMANVPVKGFPFKSLAYRIRANAWGEIQEISRDVYGTRLGPVTLREIPIALGVLFCTYAVTILGIYLGVKVIFGPAPAYTLLSGMVLVCLTAFAAWLAQSNALSKMLSLWGRITGQEFHPLSPGVEPVEGVELHICYRYLPTEILSEILGKINSEYDASVAKNAELTVSELGDLGEITERTRILLPKTVSRDLPLTIDVCRTGNSTVILLAISLVGVAVAAGLGFKYHALCKQVVEETAHELPETVERAVGRTLHRALADPTLRRSRVSVSTRRFTARIRETLGRKFVVYEFESAERQTVSMSAEQISEQENTDYTERG